MLAAQLTSFGPPEEALKVASLDDPRPGPGQLLLEMLRAAVNPADLNVIEGKYGELPELPAVIGNEGVGRVIAVGEGVSDSFPGDLVLPLRKGTWTQRMISDAGDALKLPSGIDVDQAAMLSINPPSAWAMLEDFVTLRPGDWIVQNAANSAVGRCVIQIARARGWKTLNVVRRPELIEELLAIGADVVVLETEDLKQRTRDLCSGVLPRLGLNAVGGASALNLANALADGGTLVTYGAMGRQPLKIPNGLLIFRGLNFRGFWLRQWRQDTPRDRQAAVLRELASLSLSGRLHMPVHRIYPLSEVHAAVRDAAGERRSGKVLLDCQTGREQTAALG